MAGPALVVGSVLVVLHLVAFSGLVSRQNPDLLALWLPTHCFLGRSLAAGHVPAWNPYAMAGAPFAADPQSGWMNAPAMLLYSALPCATALRWFVVLQPVLAGLGVYWFCRSEGLSRAAATTGGVALGAGIAGTAVVFALPFSASLAWTALTLAAVSRLMHAASWPGRLGWVALSALAWGQLAAAHPSTGFVLGSLAVAAYLAARIAADARSGARRPAASLAVVGVLLVAVPLVNLAWLLPRIAYFPRTNLSFGYARMERLARTFSHGLAPVSPLPGRSISPTEPLRHVASPGQYLGAAALAVTFAGWRTRHRATAIALAAFGLVCYVLSLRPVAEWGAAHLGDVRVLGVWLREPARFALGIPLAVALLAAFGVDGWRDARGWRERLLLAAPPVALWGCLPLAFGADAGYLGLFAAGAIAAGAVLVAVSRMPKLAWLIPVLLAAELVTNGLAGQAAGVGPLADSTANQRALRPLYQLARPDVRPGDVLRAGPIALALERAPGDARSVSIDPGGWDPRGLHVHQAPRSWPLLAMNQSMMLRVESAQGYDATQERRYWAFLRAVDPRRVKYNAATLEHAVPLALDLLDVGWIVAPASPRPRVAFPAPVARQGEWVLYRIAASPRAQVVPSRVGVRSGREAFATMLTGRFDPKRTVLVEGSGTGVTTGAEAASATYVALGPQGAKVDVAASVASTVLIRNVFDPGWSATLDGRPFPVLRADAFLQAVDVPAGRHTIVLSYDDPTVGFGVLGSALALLALLGAAFVLRLRRRSTSVGQSAIHAGPDPDPDEAR